MAVQRFAGDVFTVLESDTKPSNVIEGAELVELDTGKEFYFYDGNWEE